MKIAFPGVLAILLGWVMFGAGHPSAALAHPQDKKAAPQKTPLELLDEPVKLILQDEVSLKDALENLQDQLMAQGHALDFHVNTHAFKATENDQDVYRAPIRLQGLKKLPLGELLKSICDQVPGATYLVRPTHIEITTTAAAAPENQVVRAKFTNTPLDEALRELSRQTGIGIVLDARAAKKGATPMTAAFPPNTNLLTAAALLADSAGLRLRVVDRMLYVTTPDNKADIVPPGSVVPGGM
jgi:hypothetical protein